MSGKSSKVISSDRAGAEIAYAVGRTSLGSVLVARGGKGICAILLDDDPRQLKRELGALFPEDRLIEDGSGLGDALAVAVGAVEEPWRKIELPLDVRGTAFQQRVWTVLQEIPPGTTTSYAEVARRIGAPSALRAVAGACAANVLAIAIPCHRVLRSNGSLSGYRWGLERKRRLIERERRQ
jgi:AraC family transcriptional regulator of adaptative response/methylated-DNA-[protein]-cysteine methyltransferase